MCGLLGPRRMEGGSSPRPDAGYPMVAAANTVHQHHLQAPKKKTDPLSSAQQARRMQPPTSQTNSRPLQAKSRHSVSLHMARVLCSRGPLLTAGCAGVRLFAQHSECRSRDCESIQAGYAVEAPARGPKRT